jgi:hypothetical protein
MLPLTSRENIDHSAGRRIAGGVREASRAGSAAMKLANTSALSAIATMSDGSTQQGRYPKHEGGVYTTEERVATAEIVNNLVTEKA